MAYPTKTSLTTNSKCGERSGESAPSEDEHWVLHGPAAGLSIEREAVDIYDALTTGMDGQRIAMVEGESALGGSENYCAGQDVVHC
jgi:hypothetical protein